jgi:outer membrane protein assembly factor BamE (lipoprotein component of BamABCDE complex)
MRRRRGLLFSAAAVVLALLAVAVWVVPPRTKITPENAAKIEEGMTLAKVEELLGGPARNESDLADNFINDAFVLVESRPFIDRRWASRGYVVLVAFDDSGRVLRHSDMAFDVDRSFLDKLRRWLHF